MTNWSFFALAVAPAPIATSTPVAIEKAGDDYSFAVSLTHELFETIRATAWPLLFAALLLWWLGNKRRRQASFGIVAGLFEELLIRVKLGSGVKVGSFEIQANSYVPSKASRGEIGSDVKFQDEQGEHEHYRHLAKASKRVFLVHRIQPNSKARSMYDVTLYLMPALHQASPLSEIEKVEYYLGSHWNRQVYRCTDWIHGFPLTTDAYAPFLVVAKLYFKGGACAELTRFADFEMGPLDPQRVQEVDKLFASKTSS